MLTSPTRRWIPEQRLRRGSILLRSRGSASVRVSRRPDFLRTLPITQIQRFTYRWSSVSFLRLGSAHRPHGSPTMSSRPFPLNRTISEPCVIRPWRSFEISDCAGDRNRRHKAVSHVLFQSRPASRTTARERESWAASAPPGYGRASPDRPAHVWILHGKDALLGANDFAIISLLPVARSASSTTPATKNVSDKVIHERTFRDTANRCHQQEGMFQGEY